MPNRTATAVASPNIALIKYWGNLNDTLRLPVSPSISFNLAELHTTTTVSWDDALVADEVVVNGQSLTGPGYERVVGFLDHVRRLADNTGKARVTSENNFPIGTGIASSAAAFAALSLAAPAALSLELSERELSTLARLGSGSASRSVPAGFVAWYIGDKHEDSFAESVAPPDHWGLVDLIAVVSQEHKKTGSTAGHTIAASSPFQAARIATAQERFDRCLAAVMARDFAALAEVVELDSDMMHSVMMTGSPSLFYWEPDTLRIMKQVRTWREGDGLNVCYTLDAGPNVHCICTADTADTIEDTLRQMPGVAKIYRATPGGAARLR